MFESAQGELTRMMYDAPTTRALKFFDHDLVGDVRTACERIAAQDKTVATTVRRTRKT